MNHINQRQNKQIRKSKWAEGDEHYLKGKISIAGETIIPENTNEDGADFLVDVYPNPNTGYFSIIIQSPIDDIVSVEIFNITGALIYKEDDLQINKGQQDFFLNLSNFANGTYSLRIISNNVVMQKKVQIIKQYFVY